MKKINKVYLSVSIIIMVVACIFTYSTIKPVSTNDNLYSSYSAMLDLEVIAKEPHSIAQQEALADVRSYICSRLEEMGLEVGINTYTVENWYGIYDINNIVTQIDGKEGNPYILIMSHYDSTIENIFMNDTLSTGAIDAGYGVVTLLQIAEYFSKSNIPLVNGIKFLITDSEEVGPLEGSKAEVEQNLDFYSDVSLIINLEDRGPDSPAMMIQTSSKNSKIIDFYSNIKYPFTNSFMTDCYDFMYNFSDLTPFMEKGYPGLMFASFGHLKYYHSDLDNLESVNMETLQHYGEQVFTLVNKYVYDDIYSDINYFHSDKKDIFFTLPAGLFVHYGDITNIILFMITLILIIGIVIRENKIQAIQKTAVIKNLLQWIVFMFIAILSGLLISLIIYLCTGSDFNPINMLLRNINLKLDSVVFIVYTITLFVLSIMYLLKQRRKKNYYLEEYISGIILNLIVFILLSFTLKGLTYFFIIPALMSVLSVFITLTFKARFAKYTIIIAQAINILIFVPVLYILYYALTIGSLGIFGIVITLCLSNLVPMTILFVENRKILRNN